jgi:hypothetical protein
VFGGWVLAAVLALILFVWVFGALLGLVAAPFVILADLFGQSNKRSLVSYPRWPMETIPKVGDPNFEAYIRWANKHPPEPGDPTYPKKVIIEVDKYPSVPDHEGDTWAGDVPKRGAPGYRRYMRWANREPRRDG